MGFPRQEHWTRLPFPSPGDLPNPGRGPSPLASPALQADYKGLPGKPIRSLNGFKQYGAILERELLRQSQSEGETERQLWNAGARHPEDRDPLRGGAQALFAEPFLQTQFPVELQGMKNK